jgi:hypothetical protein
VLLAVGADRACDQCRIQAADIHSPELLLVFCDVLLSRLLVPCEVKQEFDASCWRLWDDGFSQLAICSDLSGVIYNLPAADCTLQFALDFILAEMFTCMGNSCRSNMTRSRFKSLNRWDLATVVSHERCCNHQQGIPIDCIAPITPSSNSWLHHSRSSV